MFDGKIIKHSAIVIGNGCSLLNFWLRDSSAVEQEAVNFKVRGSNPRRGAKNFNFNQPVG